MEKRLKELEADFLKVYQKLGIFDEISRLRKLEKVVSDPDIWKNVGRATEANQELAKLQDKIQPWELLKTQIEDLKNY